MSKLIVITQNGNLDPTTDKNLDALKRSYEKKLQKLNKISATELRQKLASVFKTTLEVIIKELNDYKSKVSETASSALDAWKTQFTELTGKFA